MKCPLSLYNELHEAIMAELPCGDENTRQRWDLFWRSDYPIQRLYDAGLNDDHIDTALRRIISSVAR
jgi:hypothetical protein